MLSRGAFRDLYVYGYDIPEAYAIEKDGNMYYAFSRQTKRPSRAKSSLRGLRPGTYRIADYVDGKEMGTVRAEPGKSPRLETDFTEHLLLEAIPQP